MSLKYVNYDINNIYFWYFQYQQAVITLVFCITFIFQTCSRACLKNAFCKMYVTIWGRFCLNEGGVAGYVNWIKANGILIIGTWDSFFPSSCFSGQSGMFRVCLKKAFCKMCVAICGRFRLNEGGVAGYVNWMKTKYTVNWGVQVAGMIFQTRSRACLKNILSCSF